MLEKKKKRKGFLIVFTGEGKGKTSAAVGLALRFIGHGMRVRMIQFVKDPRRMSGERKAIKCFGPMFELHTLGKGFIYGKGDSSGERKTAETAWAFAEEKVKAGTHDLLILDEIASLLSFGYLSPETLWNALEKRPPFVTVCLTGRGISAFFIERADLVTVMEEVRHPYHTGNRNIKGIDY